MNPLDVSMERLNEEKRYKVTIEGFTFHVYLEIYAILFSIQQMSYIFNQHN